MLSMRHGCVENNNGPYAVWDSCDFTGECVALPGPPGERGLPGPSGIDGHPGNNVSAPKSLLIVQCNKNFFKE